MIMQHEYDAGRETPPIHPMTIVRGFWRRRWIVAAWLGLSIVAGVVGGVRFGSRFYAAETALLYRPRTSVDGGVSASFDSLSLATQVNLVKVRSNLAAVRERLALPATLAELGAAADVRTQKNTNLMFIRVQWDSPETAAELANGLRDVFLMNQVRLRVREELLLVEAAHGEATLKLRDVAAQVGSVDHVLEDLQRRIEQEVSHSSEIEGLAELNIQVERRRRAIYDDQQHRANQALLAQDEWEYEQAKSLFEKGIISQLEFRRKEVAYQEQLALTEDTEEIEEWRRELDRLQALVIAPNLSAAPSARLLQEVMMQAIDLEFERVSLEEKVRHLSQASGALVRRLDELDLTTWAGSSPDSVVHLVGSDFRVLADAVAPALPTGSNRRIMAAAFTLLLGSLGVAAVLGGVLLAPTIRSAPEAKLHFGVPVLGVLPERTSLDAGVQVIANGRERALMLARRLRRLAEGRGARILVTSAEHGEGRTEVTLSVARALASDGESVLIVDGWIRAGGPVTGRHRTRMAPVSRWLWSLLGRRLRTGPQTARLDARPDTGSRSGEQGLRHFLSDEDVTFGEIVRESPCGTFHVVTRGSEDGDAPPLPSRVAAFLEEASRSFGVVLVDGPPVLPYADAETIAQKVDAVLLVVESESTLRTSVRTALERLLATGANVVGFALNRTESVFLPLG